MKLAILFPGIGYHTDKPLLYYSKKILKNMNYEIKEIHFENLDFDLNKSKDEAYKQAKDQIHKFDLKAYDSILFISKSIGTYCAAKLAHEYKLTANIYFTPLDFTLEYLQQKDLVIPENSWEQKINDVKEYHIDVVVMGSDWAGSDKFDYLKDYCEVVYLERTPGVSTTMIKNDLKLKEAEENKDQLPE